MAGSINKVILIGNLGKDPEVRKLENGATLARFSVATSESYVDKTTGEKRVNTEWHNITVWRGLAEVAEKYLKKGHKVYIEGKLKTRNWQDETGNTRYATDIIADNMTMLTSKAEAESMPSSGGGNAYPTQQPTTPNQPLADNMMSEDTDDLPF